MDYLLSIADQIWTWITTNPGPASAVAAVVTIAITVLEKFTGALSSLFTKKQPPDQEPLHVNVVATAPLAPGSDGTVTFTIEAYERRQQELKDQLTAEIEEAEGEKRELLLREKAVVEGKLANLETSFAEAEQTIQGLKDEIQRLGNELDPELREQAERVLASGDFDEAEKLFLRITDHGEMEVAKTASAYFQRGKIAEEQIRWLDAADHYKRAADLAPNPDRLAKAGEFLWRAGRSGEAVRYEEDLLAIQEREAGEAAPETATALNNLAASYRALGRFEEAERLYAKALEIDKATIGEGHPDYAIDLGNLAGLLIE
ncbi:MAG: tetratricopeptide repeat protein, partial [Pseudomonadota bacterium]